MIFLCVFRLVWIYLGQFLHFSHFHHVSLVHGLTVCFLQQGAVLRTLGVQPIHWNWNNLLVLSRYIGDPDVIPDHQLQQVLFPLGFHGYLSHSSCPSSILTAGQRL
jgi:hypothetical protein